jgi:hypothetical protein
MEQRKTRVMTDLVSNLGDPVAVAEKWLQLLKNPIPELNLR